MATDDHVHRLLGEAFRSIIREELRAVLEALRSPPAAAALDEFLSVKDAANVARVSRATVRAWIQRRMLRPYGQGRVLRVRRSELLALLAGSADQRQDQASSPDEVALSILSRQRAG